MQIDNLGTDVVRCAPLLPSPSKLLPSPWSELKLRTKTLERRMIPKPILSKIGKYNIKIGSQSVKVEVLDSAELISSWIIDHLKPKLQGEEPVIVGLDLHASKNIWGNYSANSLLVICINDANCLVVQWKYVDKKPEILKKFLGDRKNCFVGVGLERKLSRGVPPSPDLLLCQKAELSHLMARFHKKPSYCNSDLKALAAVYKMPYEPPALGGCYGCGRINYEARVFSKEEVKVLVHDAYVCYKIGQELVEKLRHNDTTEGTIRERRNYSAMKQLCENSGNVGIPRDSGNTVKETTQGTQGTTQGTPCRAMKQLREQLKECRNRPTMKQLREQLRKHRNRPAMK
ncbi:hypothetical protein Nepgr_013889 [Nepenthes gracilis]|uniref:3'-5' exonuclease domain-containing protein n=1 Tax=Nepenthes gracilis TaxID=150966 RepID=A0AAD3SIM1_NEPGR|nr:hypothetical protein Nepgr_013889 [Nepenthes gracilis]